MSDRHSDLTETLESIREEEFPDLSTDLVNAIVEAEYETLENRSKSQSRVSALIESHLEERGESYAEN